MKLVAQIKLLPAPEQATLLDATLQRINAACCWLGEQAWATQTFHQYDLHHLCYRDCREKFGLSAQATVRAIAKVADAYKLDRKRRRSFGPHGGASYDARLLTWRDGAVSIWTLSSRILVPFVCGKRQAELLRTRQGESDLCSRGGMFFLFATCDAQEPTIAPCTDFLGVDLGVANLATTSDGECYSGEGVEAVRRRCHRARKAIGRKMHRSQKRSTRRNARRAMRRIGNREGRFRRHQNHCISKQIVARAKDTQRGLAVEDLKGVRERTRFRKAQRAKMGGWAFHQLRAFLSYKAKLHGVLLVAVDPRNTSRTCSVCGYCDKANRPSQERFRCLACGFQADADFNAATNIAAAGAVVSRPEGSKRLPLSTAA